MALKLGFSSSEMENRASPMSSPDINVSEINGKDDDRTAGYDYEFVPTLDNKYMCPICLLALRDPVQTECGHRFCHLCILQCIRNKSRCPVDQIALTPNQLFQDRSAHREVLDLKVKCNNVGCTVVLELRNIQRHIDSCPFLKVACRHKCGLSLLVQDCVHHEDNQCPLRPVTCPVCRQQYPFNAHKEHEEDCKQHEPVDCPHCNHTVKRYRLNQHVSGECPQAPIKCVFDKVGCLREHSRFNIQKHMESSTQVHLQYLLSTVIALQKQNDALQENLRETQEKLRKTEQTNDRSCHGTTSSMGVDMDIDDHSTITDSFNLYDSEPNIPPIEHTNNGSEVFDDIDYYKALNKQMEESDGTGISSSSSAASSPAVLPNTLNGVIDTCSCSAAAGLKVLSHKHTDHDEKIVSLDHHVRELMAKMETQITQIKEINTKISSVEQRMDQQELRCGNGLYYWRIKEYTKLRKAATQGDIPVLHSPGFYTSPQGYRMCIRANLNGVENSQGTHLSLFVHIMKGEYDDILFWPFRGSITLTVINQCELPSQRSHISETLEAHSNLMAFQRPSTERNQKGYGYIDFFPLKTIESEGFIKANSLLIKAQVRVYDSITK